MEWWHLGRSAPVCQNLATTNHHNARFQPSTDQINQYWPKCGPLCIAILAHSWHTLHVLVWPIYCVQWWHYGGPHPFAKSGPQSSHAMPDFNPNRDTTTKSCPGTMCTDGLPYVWTMASTEVQQQNTIRVQIKGAVPLDQALTGLSTTVEPWSPQSVRLPAPLAGTPVRDLSLTRRCREATRGERQHIWTCI